MLPSHSVLSPPNTRAGSCFRHLANHAIQLESNDVVVSWTYLFLQLLSILALGNRFSAFFGGEGGAQRFCFKLLYLRLEVSWFKGKNMTGVAQWVEHCLMQQEATVPFPARALARAAGSIPSTGHAAGS